MVLSTVPCLISIGCRSGKFTWWLVANEGLWLVALSVWAIVCIWWQVLCRHKPAVNSIQLNVNITNVRLKAQPAGIRGLLDGSISIRDRIDRNRFTNVYIGVVAMGLTRFHALSSILSIPSELSTLAKRAIGV